MLISLFTQFQWHQTPNCQLTACFAGQEFFNVFVVDLNVLIQRHESNFTQAYFSAAISSNFLAVRAFR